MLAQRKDMAADKRRSGRETASKETAAKERTASGAAAAVEAPKARGKLSYKQKFAIETLPRQIAERQAKAGEIEARMADPAFFARDPDGFAKAAKALAALQAEVATMEEEWLELEMLREELEG